MEGRGGGKDDGKRGGERCWFCSRLRQTKGGQGFAAFLVVLVFSVEPSEIEERSQEVYPGGGGPIRVKRDIAPHRHAPRFIFSGRPLEVLLPWYC